MSGEVPPAKRIGFAKLAPGDVLFFGPSGPRSKPASIGHTGIYLGGGWMIHSSGQGVAADAAHRLVPPAIRLGPPAARRSRPDRRPLAPN